MTHKPPAIWKFWRSLTGKSVSQPDQRGTKTIDLKPGDVVKLTYRGHSNTIDVRKKGKLVLRASPTEIGTLAECLIRQPNIYTGYRTFDLTKVELNGEAVSFPQSGGAITDI